MLRKVQGKKESDIIDNLTGEIWQSSLHSVIFITALRLNTYFGAPSILDRNVIEQCYHKHSIM